MSTFTAGILGRNAFPARPEESCELGYCTADKAARYAGTRSAQAEKTRAFPPHPRSLQPTIHPAGSPAPKQPSAPAAAVPVPPWSGGLHLGADECRHGTGFRPHRCFQRPKAVTDSSSAALIASRRPRNNAANSSGAMTSGSAPAALKASPLLKSRKSSLPNRRGSTKRSSLPLSSSSRACVCAATGASGVVTSNRPVMPRCTIHCASGCRAALPRRFPLGAVASSHTMCFPVRCTATSTRPSRPLVCRAAGVLNNLL